MSHYATAVDAVLDLQESICRHAIFSLGKPWRDLSTHDRFAAVALAVRDRMVERMLETEEEYRQARRQAPVLPVNRISDRAIPWE